MIHTPRGEIYQVLAKFRNIQIWDPDYEEQINYLETVFITVQTIFKGTRIGFII